MFFDSPGFGGSALCGEHHQAVHQWTHVLFQPSPEFPAIQECSENVNFDFESKARRLKEATHGAHSILVTQIWRMLDWFTKPYTGLAVGSCWLMWTSVGSEVTYGWIIWALWCNMMVYDAVWCCMQISEWYLWECLFCFLMWWCVMGLSFKWAFFSISSAVNNKVCWITRTQVQGLKS